MRKRSHRPRCTWPTSLSSLNAFAQAPEPEGQRQKKQREPEIDSVHRFAPAFEPEGRTAKLKKSLKGFRAPTASAGRPRLARRGGARQRLQSHARYSLAKQSNVGCTDMRVGADCK